MAKETESSKKLDPHKVVAQGLKINPRQMSESGYFGWCIVVADRGFVWIGDCLFEGDDVYCCDALNIRSWGVQKGLGQLATTGPTEATELDPVPVVVIPRRAVIAMIPAKEEPWKKHRVK